MNRAERIFQMTRLDRWLGRRGGEFEATPFESIDGALPMLRESSGVPITSKDEDGPGHILYMQGDRENPERAVIPVRNNFIEYDLMLTHDRGEEVLSLGVELHPSSPVNDGFVRDILLENPKLNNAKLGMELGSTHGLYRIVATSEMSTPALTNEQVSQQIRTFDRAVTFEYDQVHRLAEKNGIELPDVLRPSIRPMVQDALPRASSDFAKLPLVGQPRDGK
jgi:hypothetical protein